MTAADLIRTAPMPRLVPRSALVLGALAVAACVACVPSGSAPPYDAGTPAVATTAAFRASVNVMTATFEDTFDRPDAEAWLADASSLSLVSDAGEGRDGGERRSESDGGSPLLAALLRDSGAGGEGSHGNLGPNWTQIKTSAWHVEGGKLCGQNAHNHGIWLNRTLPINARIEFEATAYTDDGDLKTEVWGDGSSYATGTSYTNATSYLAILGGWKNTLHVLARLNEHGTDRKEIKVDKESDDPRQRPVQKGQTYHFKVERNDGKTIRWSVDGIDFYTWVDAQPLAGQGHDHFGFNEWEAKVCYDNVKVTPL